MNVAAPPPANEDSARPHQIRLHGPWQLIRPVAARLRVPLTLGALQQSVRLDDTPDTAWVFVRRLGCPTGLTRKTRVYLDWAAIDLPITLKWNQEPVRRVDARRNLRIDVTDSLESRNEIHVTIPIEERRWRDPEKSPFWLIRSVRLEIIHHP